MAGRVRAQQRAGTPPEELHLAVLRRRSSRGRWDSKGRPTTSHSHNILNTVVLTITCEKKPQTPPPKKNKNKKSEAKTPRFKNLTQFRTMTRI